MTKDEIISQICKEWNVNSLYELDENTLNRVEYRIYKELSYLKKDFPYSGDEFTKGYEEVLDTLEKVFYNILRKEQDG